MSNKKKPTKKVIKKTKEKVGLDPITEQAFDEVLKKLLKPIKKT